MYTQGRPLQKLPVEGVGHFEPLRHYAEVHLWMEPGEGEQGSGLQFETNCSEDMLDRNWQEADPDPSGGKHVMWELSLEPRSQI